ncbi:MAG: cob(I)yrinic acid a,c-diamide adenosyltransferase [Methanomicrobia archaeon]|nr:cob(I)yrinic acid a,c-diamide adenosyltransferase [Methanomicrobia archaeon]MCK4636344.1 cob(I)yrinic acid a,c-diamide adenosyltransferase [Methanomicrobia archaeon]
MKGLVEVYTGNGKGKTTAALGIAFRALGHGYKVYMIQFMKSVCSGECIQATKTKNFKINSFGRASFVNKDNPDPLDIKYAKEALDFAKEIVIEGKYDIVILDEINVALDFKLIDIANVIDLIKNKPDDVELIFTGRNAPKEIIDVADLVSEIKEIKHPLSKGISSRKGIEY